MSKQTSRIIPNDSLIAGFMGSVTKLEGFKDHGCDYQPPKCLVIPADTISLRVWKPYKVNLFRTEELNVEITLMRHRHLPVYLVSTFSVTLGVVYISGNVFLGHFGKRFASSDYKGHNDFEDNDVSEFWTVSCPENVAALMRSYDTFAKYYGFPVVFNL